MFSIIIPVFNAENTLATAINSVLNQSFSDWELLVVDDASTDGSFHIAERFANNDTRIKVLRLLQNSGNAKLPRDTGVKDAIGEYCLFLDSDDELSSDYLQIMAECINKYSAEVVLPIIVKKTHNSIGESRYNDWLAHDRVLTGPEACRYTIPSWHIGTAGMSFKRSLYQNDFEQNPYYFTYSDEISERLILFYAKTVVGSTAQYTYWQHQLSITHKKSVKLYEILPIDRQLLDFTMGHYDDVIISRQFNAMLSHLMVLQKDLYRYTNVYSLDEKKRISNILEETFNYLRNVTGIRKSFKEKMLLMNVCAFRLFCWMRK